MSRIERLTPEQEIALRQHHAEWLQVGLCTESADRERAEQAISAMYRHIGKEPPCFVWCDSPLAAAQAMASLGDSLGDSLWDSLGASLWDSLGASLWDSLRAGFWGQHEGFWIAYYRFPEQHLGVRYDPAESEQLGWWEAIARSCSWWWPYERVCIISDRPRTVQMEPIGPGSDRLRLHGEDGPAVAYRDGWGVWAWHGVRVPQQVIESPETLTVEQVHGERNVEISRVMVERMDYDRYLRESHAVLVHRDDWGTLWRGQIPGDPEPLMMVELVNSTPEPDGSARHYFLRVRTDLQPMTPRGPIGTPQELTALNAVASTFGMTGEQYRALEIQT